jgi:DNA-binding NtrC family response regulator
METLGTNIFIVDENQSMLSSLKQYLQNRFGKSVHISTFTDSESCLKKVDKRLNIVILDDFLKGDKGLETLKSIKAINPETEVIMLSKKEDVARAIESFKAGATDYVVKGSNSWKRLSKIVNFIITAPIRAMEREFSISKFLAIFLLAFATLGIVALCTLLLMKK